MPASARNRPKPVLRHTSSVGHYHSFPTNPPKSKGRPPINGGGGDASKSSPISRSDSQDSHSSSSSKDVEQVSPLPVRQLFVLAVIALAEQTSLNSISPYLPAMTAQFPDVVDKSKVGLYVGIIASSFALAQVSYSTRHFLPRSATDVLAQFTTNLAWGWLSDKIGRKPVILVGTLLTAASFVAFGFCKTLWQAIVVQLCMGLVNGNQGIVSTVLGEITDRTNQSKAFTYLPVVYGRSASHSFGADELTLS